MVCLSPNYTALRPYIKDVNFEIFSDISNEVPECFRIILDSHPHDQSPQEPDEKVSQQMT
jgi:hypothetical protein